MATTLAEIIDWDKANPNHLLPNQILKWVIRVPIYMAKKEPRVKAGDLVTFFWNMSNGLSSMFLEDVMDESDFKNKRYAIHDKDPKNDRGNKIRIHVEYIEPLDSVLVEFYSCGFWQKRGEVLGRRPFELIHKIYVTRKKEIWESENVACHKFSLDVDGKHSYRWLYDIPTKDVNNGDRESIIGPMQKLFGPVVNVGANRTIRLNDVFSFGWFLSYKEPAVKLGKKGKRIKELVEKYSLRKIPYDKDAPTSVGFIEKVDDGLAVIRTMDNYSTSYGYMVDKARVYVSKDEIVSCRPNNTGDWVPMVLKSNLSNWNFQIEDFDVNDVKGTKLEYFTSIISGMPPKKRTAFLVSILGFPWLEAIAKTDMLPVLLQMIDNTWEKLGNSVIDFFGGINTQAKKLYDIVGLNKHQLAKVSEFYKKVIDENYSDVHRIRIIRCLKSVFAPPHGKDNAWVGERGDTFPSIQDIDNNTFDFVFDMLERSVEKGTYLQEGLHYMAYALHLLRTTYSTTAMIRNAQNVFDVSKKKVSVTHVSTSGKPWTSSYRCSNYLCDYYDVVRKMKDTSNFRPNFDPEDPQQIVNMHDAAVAVYNAIGGKTESLSCGSSKITEAMKNKWKKWEYEEDEFSVVSPLTLGEIALEGIELHHCAKAYVEKVAKNETNVLFIRMTDDINTPFYTVEIDNKGCLLQIAGFANYYPSGNNAILEFVKRWCKKKSIIDLSQ